MESSQRSPINLFEFAEFARDQMEPAEFDYVEGGVTDEITLRRTRSAYDSIALRPRVLRGFRQADMTTNVLGRKLPVPFMLAPCGGHGRAHPEGEIATARGAAAFGTVLGVSANASFTLEQIAQAADGPRWYQLYFYRDREQTAEMVKRAESAGYEAICITLDANWPSKRERNIRNAYQQGNRPMYKDRPEAPSQGKFDTGQSSRGRVDPGANWEDLQWLRGLTDLPIVFKGIMTGEDATLCAQVGVNAAIVSNHGARNLDTTLSTIEVLPEIVAASQGQVEVYLDGGIRRGTDVVKALAMGARAVLLGRPLFYGLALGGDEGVAQMLDVLRDELEATMMHTGRSRIAELDRSLIASMPTLDGSSA